jgi:hypothetical protein
MVVLIENPRHADGALAPHRDEATHAPQAAQAVIPPFAGADGADLRGGVPRPQSGATRSDGLRRDPPGTTALFGRNPSHEAARANKSGLRETVKILAALCSGSDLP